MNFWRNSSVSNNSSYWGWNPRTGPVVFSKKKPLIWIFYFSFQSNQQFLHTQLRNTLINWLWSDGCQALSCLSGRAHVKHYITVISHSSAQVSSCSSALLLTYLSSIYQAGISFCFFLKAINFFTTLSFPPHLRCTVFNSVL